MTALRTIKEAKITYKMDTRMEMTKIMKISMGKIWAKKV